MLTETELEMLDTVDDPVIKGVILTMDKALDDFQVLIGELENKVRKLEKRLDNV